MSAMLDALRLMVRGAYALGTAALKAQVGAPTVDPVDGLINRGKGRW